jgi:hypothetical protein
MSCKVPWVCHWRSRSKADRLRSRLGRPVVQLRCAWMQQMAWAAHRSRMVTLVARFSGHWQVRGERHQTPSVLFRLRMLVDGH